MGMNYQKKAIEIMDNVSKVIVGKEDVTKLVLTSLIAGGHVLLEDVPGTGKTMLAKTVAKSVDAQFSRIQFTPDLLPSDVTGINYYNQKAGEFVFRRGPVFSNILLADEINRATPRTQSALLECMEEHQVTVDSDTYRLEEPFLVIATQNPIETAGTYQLPEAQLDRFLMKNGFPRTAPYSNNAHTAARLPSTPDLPQSALSILPLFTPVFGWYFYRFHNCLHKCISVVLISQSVS